MLSVCCDMECWYGSKTGELEDVPMSGIVCEEGIGFCQISTQYGKNQSQLEHLKSDYDCSAIKDSLIPEVRCIKNINEDTETHICYFQGKDTNGEDLSCNCNELR